MRVRIQYTFALLLAAAVSTVTQAQTATIAPIAFTDSGNGMLQAPNGNFYFPSLPDFDECEANQHQDCAFIYQLTPGGVVSVFHAFQPVDDSAGPVPANADGIWPTAFILGTDGNFYGACKAGGVGGFGTIYQITPAGNLTVLKSFGLSIATLDGLDIGNQPLSLMQGNDGNLYFTNGVGVYGLTPTGNLLTIYTFPTNGALGIAPSGTGSSSLVQASDGNLYFPMTTAPQTIPGTETQGAIGQLTLGGQFNVIHALADDGSEGYVPLGPLTEGPDGNLYGVTQYSGITPPYGFGVAFSVSKTGKYTVLHRFSGLVGNRNGAMILGGDGNLYGTTLQGGNTTSPNCAPVGCGTIYKLTPGGLYTNLHSFNGGIPTSTIVAQNLTVDGAGPTTPLVQTGDGSFYGATIGNPASVAVVYKASLTPAIPAPITLAFNTPQITIGNSAILSWQILNGYSLTSLQCGASIVGGSLSAGNWSGQQTGTRVNGIYSGGATITPTKPGTYTYALTCGGTETQFATLVVLGITPLQIQTAALQQGVVSQPYQSILSVTGGTPPYTWSTGGLPKGIALDPGTGILSGTPLQYGDYTLAFGVQDSSNPPETTGVQLAMTVISGLTLSPSLPNPVVATQYSQPLRISGGLPPYQWQVVTGKLPDGLQLNTQSGVVSGTATTPGQYSFTISVSDSENPKAIVQQTVALSIAVPALTITTDQALPRASVGQPYSITLAATGGTPPYTWTFGNNTFSGLTVPPGLTLSSAGVLSGTPTEFTQAPGDPAFTDLFNVTVTDSENPKVSVSGALELGVLSTLQLTVTSLPTGMIGVQTEVPLTATGGIPPYTWTAASNPDPNMIGLYLEVNKLVFQPLIATNATVIITVTDSENQPRAATVTVTLPLTFLPAALVTTTTLTSSNSVAGTGQSVTLTATVSIPSGATPSGPVTFFNGTTSLGMATLDASGHATLQTSFATPGVYSITAAYAGNGTYAASTSSPLTETVVAPSITAAVNPGSLTVQSGSSGQLVITITPTGGYTGTINFSCGTLPAHVSCVFAPTSLTIAAGSGPITDTLTVSTNAPQMSMLSRPPNTQIRNITVLALIFWFPGSLASLAGLFRRRRGGATPRPRGLWIVAVLCLAVAGAITGCGGSNSSPNAKAGTYTLSIALAASGAATQNISATVIVQ